MRLAALFPGYVSFGSVPRTALRLCQHMHSRALGCELFADAVDPALIDRTVRPTTPNWLPAWTYRYIGPRVTGRCTRARFLRRLGSDDIAYLWPGVGSEVYQAVRERGSHIVTELVNTHTRTARELLAPEYAAEGYPLPNGYSDAAIADDDERLDLADYIFSPSPLVTRSLLSNGVAGDKILQSRYGYDPTRLRLNGQPSQHPALPPIAGPTVAFVGLVCLRKGAHRLLRAWADAKVAGRLVLAGPIAPEIRERCGDLLDRPDVHALGRVDDIAQIFHAADLIAFPSFEEGSPLATYEAMAVGVPMIASPMGAGGVLTHEQHGYVLDPTDHDAWVDALRRLANDRELRQQLAANCRTDAQRLTWADAGRDRRALLLEAMSMPADDLDDPQPTAEPARSA